jgi:hypothetical protein
MNMNAEEFDLCWQKYSTLTEKNFQLNKSILIDLKSTKLKDKIKRSIIIEIIAILIYIISIIFLLSYTSIYINELKYLFPEIVSCIILVFYIIFSCIRLFNYEKINDLSLPICTVQRKILTQKKKSRLLGIIELSFAPMLFVSILPLLYVGILHIDIYENLSKYLIIVCIGCVIGFGFSLLTKKFDKRLSSIEKLIIQIGGYEKLSI